MEEQVAWVWIGEVGEQESTKVWITQQQVKKEETLTEKMKRSDERHTKHMEAIETFRRSQMYFSIRKEYFFSD